MAQVRTPFGLRMSPKMRDWVVARAKDEGRSANNFILQIITAKMNGHVSKSVEATPKCSCDNFD